MEKLYELPLSNQAGYDFAAYRDGFTIEEIDSMVKQELRLKKLAAKKRQKQKMKENSTESDK